MSDIYIDRLVSRLDTQDVVIQLQNGPIIGRELLSSIYHYSRSLSALGVGRSSLVAIYAPNSPDALAVRYAANMLGGGYMYLPLLPIADMRREMLLGVQPDFLVVFKETQWAVEGLGDGWRTCIMLVGVGLEGDGVHRVDLPPTIDYKSTVVHSVASLAQSDELCAVIASGGTTGPPKASWRTFAQYTSNTNMEFTSTRRQLVNGPLANLSHILLDATLLAGGVVILDDCFDPSRTLQLIQSERVTDFFLVEPQLALLIDHDDLASADFSKLKTITHVGDSAPLALRQKAAKVFGNRMRHIYAASESAGVALSSGKDYTTIKPGMINSSSHILPGVNIQIRSPITGEILDDGNAGRVEIQGQNVASGYRPELKATPHTPRFLGNGKILLNDIARRHGDFLEFLGREGEVIYAAKWDVGEPTTATQLQDTLLRLAGIKHATVMRDVKTSTWITAIVPRNMTVSPHQVEKVLRGEHLVDKLCVLLLEDLPLTPQGKVDRRQIFMEASKASSDFTVNLQKSLVNPITQSAGNTRHTTTAKLEFASSEGVTSSNSDGSSGSPNEKHDVTRSINGLRWFLVCIGTFSANLLYGLDTTIAADIQGAVSSAFDNTTQLGWLGIGFGLGSTVAILPIGKAYGMFNTKSLFVGSLLNFAAGSCLCGAAPSMTALVVGRVWAGAGGAGMYLGTINIMAAIATPEEVSFYFALEAIVYGAGCILGPVVGGILADSKVTWRWAFYLNLIIFAIMSPIYAFILPSIPRRKDIRFLEKINKLDWLGMVITAAMYTCFILAFTFGGAIWAWGDGRLIALAVLSAVFAVVFAVTQYYAVLTDKTSRLFACEFVGQPQLVLLYIAMACGGATQFITTYYIPLYFIFVYGDTGTEAAIRLLPFICCYVVAILTCGYAMPRLGYHILWYFASGLLMATGGIAMYTIDTNTPTSHAYGFSALLGFGLTVSQAGYGLGTRLVHSSRAPDVIQFMNIAQGQSATLGLVIASAIFQSEAFAGLQKVLSSQGFSESQIHAAIAGSRSEVLQMISPELKKQCLAKIVEAIRLNWVLVIVAGSLQIIISLFISRKRF